MRKTKWPKRAVALMRDSGLMLDVAYNRLALKCKWGELGDDEYFLPVIIRPSPRKRAKK